MFGDPEYLDLMVRMFQHVDADPESPEISRLADDTVDWMASRWDSTLDAWYFDQGLDDPAANALLDAQWDHKPAWIRLSELILDRLRDRGLHHPAMEPEQ
ncbi:hypothetical protein [Aeromicrobium sp. UC242_57]|uniref:hypothetical protein n=1 Tax=Aeromicrobium sp. UC242_57 TaxID=3374624 RepID=UPI00379E3663